MRDFRSKEINRKIVGLKKIESIPIKENLYFFTIYKIKGGLTLDF